MLFTITITIIFITKQPAQEAFSENKPMAGLNSLNENEYENYTGDLNTKFKNFNRKCVH